MGGEQPKKTVDKRMTPGFLAQAGKGRPKGVRNKVTLAVKELIIGALHEVGGIEYLKKQAKENPAAFMTLVGKVIPLDINANVAVAPAFTVDDWVVPLPAEGFGPHGNA